MLLLFNDPGALTKLSLTEMCSVLGNHGVYMSKEALNKRFNRNAVDFLKEIYLHLFELQANLSLSSIQLTTNIPFNSIRIMDGTTVTLPDACSSVYPGTVGAGVKYQIEFDYLTGRFNFIEVQPGKAGDSPAGMKRLQNVLKNDLILQDLGYFKYDMLKQINQKEAFYVSRARVDTMFYTAHPNPRYHLNGEIVKKSAYERLLLEDEVKTITRGEMREYSSVYLGKHEKLPVRLIVYRMTQREQQRQEHRIKRREQTKPGKIKNKSRDLSGLSIFITNLPSTTSSKEVVELYSYRWQIELLFRSWKSDLKLNLFRNMKLERWECHLYTELIILLLTTLITFQLKVYFWKEKQMILSEQIAMRVIVKKIGMLWRSRDGTEWQNTLSQILEILTSIGRKNIKEPGPIGWHNK